MLRDLFQGLTQKTEVPKAPSNGESSQIQLLPAIETFIVSGGPLDPQLHDNFKELTGKPVFEGYGLTECLPLVTSNRPAYTNKPGSVGRQLPGLEVSIFDDNGFQVPQGEVGEIVVRGAGIMQGYHKRREETVAAIQDEWLYTGDWGRLGVAGYLYIVDRKDDLITRGGFQIYSQEIEALLNSQPDISECAVVGIPDKIYGEKVKAYIVLNNPNTITIDQLKEICAAKLRTYQSPYEFEIRRELPKGPTGKILKHLLRTVQEARV